MRKSIIFLLVGVLIGVSLALAGERYWRDAHNWENSLRTTERQLAGGDTVSALNYFLRNTRPKGGQVANEAMYKWSLDKTVRMLLRERSYEIYQNEKWRQKR